MSQYFRFVTIDVIDGKEKKFVFVTDLNITKRNASRIVLAGRSRWKIENLIFIIYVV
ncbi:MAG: hypothetical protein KAX49_05215 [Halanaerobiales bacterium]|nr:hypothetical protein [Halanaerobiales bacterium]